MKIVLLRDGDLHTLETDNNDPDQTIKTITITSPVDDELAEEFAQCYGVYGHPIDFDNTTNLDLLAASTQLETFDFYSSEPEIPASTAIPAGAQS